MLFCLCTSLNFVRETQTGFLQMLSIEHGESFTNMKSSFYDLSDDYTCHCSNSFDLPIISSLISTHVCLRFFFSSHFSNCRNTRHASFLGSPASRCKIHCLPRISKRYLDGFTSKQILAKSLLFLIIILSYCVHMHDPGEG